jgi:hypothetical protein
MPSPELLLTRTFDTSAPLVAKRSMPSSPQPSIPPFLTVTLKSVPVAATPSSVPGRPNRQNPLRSRVTLLASI